MTGPFTRRELLEKTTAVSAAATLTIMPRHVLGGAGYVAPSEKMNIAGIGIGGMGAAQPEEPGVGKHRRALRRRSQLRRQDDSALLQREVLHRLSRAARSAEGHRRRGDRHARPHPRGDHHGGHPGGQARLLPEAADPRRLRSPDAGQGGAGIAGHHPDGHPGPLGRRHPPDLRVDRARASSARSARSMPGAASRITPGATPGGARSGPSAPRRRQPVPAGLNWDLLDRPGRRCGPTIGPITRPPGAAGGISAAA